MRGNIKIAGGIPGILVIIILNIIINAIPLYFLPFLIIVLFEIRLWFVVVRYSRFHTNIYSMYRTNATK